MGVDYVVDNIVNSCGFIYSLYELWVVYAFKEEIIKSQKQEEHRPSFMTI